MFPERTSFDRAIAAENRRLNAIEARRNEELKRREMEARQRQGELDAPSTTQFPSEVVPR
jgi:hypothetical protein